MARLVLWIMFVALLATLVDASVTQVTGNQLYGFLAGAACSLSMVIAVVKDGRKVDKPDE